MFFACQSSVFESPWSTELESNSPPPVCLDPFWAYRLVLVGGFRGREPGLVFFFSVVDAGGSGYLCALGSSQSFNPGTSWGAEAALGLEGAKPWAGIVEDGEFCLLSVLSDLSGFGRSSEARPQIKPPARFAPTCSISPARQQSFMPRICSSTLGLFRQF